MKVVQSLLIIDDNVFDVEIAERILTRTGRFKHVYAVADGREALALFRDYDESRAQYPDKFPPLVILLDINMPVLNGFEFLEAYAQIEHWDGIKTSIIVMLTSSGSTPDRDRALANDLVEDYIVKPLTTSAAHALADRLGQ